MSQSGKYNFYIYQGATLRKPFVWNAGGSPVVLTGYHARFKMWTIPAPVLTGNTPVAPTLVLSITDVASADGTIFLGTRDGTTVLAGGVTVYIPDTKTELFTDTLYTYSLQMVAPNGDALPPLLSGRIKMLDLNGVVLNTNVTVFSNDSAGTLGTFGQGLDYQGDVVGWGEP